MTDLKRFLARAKKNTYATQKGEVRPSRRLIEVLREALQRVTEDRPYRGPREYMKGDFLYECAEQGTPDFLNGTERIYYHTNEIYRLYFHDGRIRFYL